MGLIDYSKWVTHPLTQISHEKISKAWLACDITKNIETHWQSNSLRGQKGFTRQGKKIAVVKNCHDAMRASSHQIVKSVQLKRSISIINISADVRIYGWRRVVD